MWFAFNLLSLTYWKQPSIGLPLTSLVVICFQSIIFDILKTTRADKRSVKFVLWFAFNLLSLTYWKQLKEMDNRSNLSCDLLSIYYLWHTENNNSHKQALWPELWFAFNLLSLTYWKQQKTAPTIANTGCDLLSIYYLWHTENNHGRMNP